MPDHELVEGACVPRLGEPHQLVVRHTACRPGPGLGGWVPCKQKGRRNRAGPSCLSHLSYPSHLSGGVVVTASRDLGRVPEGRPASW